MKDLLKRLENLVAELKANDNVQLVSDFVGEPATAEAIAEIEAKLDAPLDPDLRAFYEQCNGVSICWQMIPGTDPQWLKSYQTEPVWYFEESEGGGIVVEPIEVVFGSRMDGHDIREMAAESFYGEPIREFGKELDAETFFATMWPISWFFEGNAVMINSHVKNEEGRCSLVVQGDQGLESPVQGLTFGAWFDYTINSFGFVSEQRSIYRGWNDRYTPGSLAELVPTPDAPAIITYYLADVPSFFTEEVPAGDIGNCLFYIARDRSHTADLFAEMSEPHIDHVQAGLNVAKNVARAATCSGELAPTLRPDEVPAGGRLFGGSYNVGFHTQPGADTQAWFDGRGFDIRPISDIFEGLFFLRVKDENDEPVRSLKKGSATVNAGIKYDVDEIMPGIYAFEVGDHANEHFALWAGDRSVELRAADFKPNELTDVVV